MICFSKVSIFLLMGKIKSINYKNNDVRNNKKFTMKSVLTQIDK